MDWLEEAQLDRVGAFRFEPVEGAAANALPDPVPEELKEERYARLMDLTARISADKLAAKVGRTLDVLIDAVDDEGGATGRSKADAPEIDGEVHLRDAGHLAAGDIVRVADRGQRRARPVRRAASLGLVASPCSRPRHKLRAGNDRLRIPAESPTAASLRGPIHLVDKAAFACLARRTQCRGRAQSMLEATGSMPRPLLPVRHPAGEEGRRFEVVTLSSIAPTRWRRGASPSWPNRFPPARTVAAGRAGPGRARLAARPAPLRPLQIAPSAKRAGPRVLLTADAASIDAIVRLAEATALVRDLVDTPAADMGPAELEAAVRDLGKASRRQGRGHPRRCAVDRLSDDRRGRRRRPRATARRA